MKFDHHCHIQKMKAPEFENYRVVVWDVETIQTKEIPDEGNIEQEEDMDEPNWGEDKLPHRVNTLCVRIACRDCIESGRWKDKNYDGCPACGPNRCRVFTDFDGEDPVDSFLDMVIDELPKGLDTYAYSHNGGRFDNHFLMQKLYQRGGEPPKMQATGGKIFQLKLKRSKTVGGNVYFRDSYMIMMNALDKLPEVFGFKGPGLKKMFFPYLFNLPENYGRQLNHLPHHRFYVPETMSTEKRQKFKKWYRRNRRQPFELCEKLVEYCTSDVNILMEAMVRLRALIKDEFTDGVDLLPTFTTMAGLCQRVYRLKHYNVDDKTPLAAFTETGYHKLDRQSTIAMKWLKWFAAAHNVNVQTRESKDGEKRIGKYKVDGFIPVAERNGPNFKFCDDRACLYCYHESAKLADTVLEFQGCAYHGCNLCFKNTVKCPNGKKSDENYARTKTKIEYLQEEHHVVEMWECQLKDTLKEEERDEMKQFFADCIDTGPLDPRQAFFGGRTGPASLRYKKKPGYAIKYLDVCSLYPHVMRKEYPISKPTLIAHIGDEGFVSDVSWAMPADNPYRGLVKVRVHPPKHLVHPVLPVKHADRLVFPLCRTCMEGSVDRRAYREPGCNHTEDQRSWVGTYFTDELNLALSHGYRVDMVIGVWHWDDDQWTDQHFKGYINTFVRMKTEASGWKKAILNAANPEKAKDEFIEAYRLKGIHLRKDKIKANPGLKEYAKLGANNLWGRFGLRPNMSKIEIVSKPSRLYEILDGPQYNVMEVVPLSSRLVRVSYRHREEFHPTDPFGNIIVALITASYGRMELFKYIEMADERMNGPKGSRALYTDTDSLTFRYKIDPTRPDNGCPVPTGKVLGDMEDEYPEDDIMEYVSGGNKQYALFMKNKGTGKRWSTLKIRGITLDYRTSKKLTTKRFKKMVRNSRYADPVQVEATQIKKDKKSRIYTHRIFKKYVPYFKKAWIDKNDEIWPYGYVPLDDKVEDMLVSAPSTPIPGYTPAASPDIFNP
ncbi:hypothetical protein AAVH_34415, partial [Aphelenchoides avenae]